MSAATLKKRTLNRPLFGKRYLQRSGASRVNRVPAANVTETPETYIIKLAVPGIDRQCLSIHCKDNILFIGADKEDSLKSGKEGKELFEYNYYHWERRFMLPEDADPLLAQASYTNGELIIMIPRDGERSSLKGETDVYVY
ncbi:Hsp20/alpha crystallin family protein [Flavihumibacter rivuli]|uniref:Hsp20/alpha crystallin family protein n=1 Tax=Flavihumibacter rivuli TaxID=2838156 RepID=UPI001BDEE35F|nr:Hsp20/alpha crystallin family protein [Flavihumibacter rivuli]ULQ58401.1 Hsp20/alpha crystallin family protein [Flavihumibacter rivuli]